MNLVKFTRSHCSAWMQRINTGIGDYDEENHHYFDHHVHHLHCFSR